MSMMKQSKQYRREQFGRWKTTSEIMKTQKSSIAASKREVARTVMNTVLVEIKKLRDTKPTNKDTYIKEAINLLVQGCIQLKWYVDPQVYPKTSYNPKR